jgi:tRNA(Ile)-lysidine synthase
MAARKLRHEFLARTAAQRHIRSIALAHHADDQLELFFLRLLRGTSGEGLAGMKWRNPSPVDARIELVRPLLAQPKAALCQYARQNRIPFREDATNASIDIQRNRIRHELLPLLRGSYQPALDKTVLRLMEIVGAEAHVVTEAAREWLGREVPQSYKGYKSYKVTSERVAQRAGKALQSFDDLSVAVQRRCVQLQLLELGLVADFELVERLRLCPDKPVSVAGFESTQNGKGPARKPTILAVRDGSGRVRLGSSEPHQFNGNSTEQPLAGNAGKLSFDGVNIQWKLTRRKPKGPLQPRTGREWFDADRVGSPISLRHWQPGDRFQPIGLAKSVKLQDFFTNEKIPQSRRHELLLGLTREGEVFWVEGLRIAERFKLTVRTIRALQWRWHRLLIQ